MDIQELMKFKPVTAPKRPAADPSAAAAANDDEANGGGGGGADDLEDDPSESYESRAAKRRKRQRRDQKRHEQERLAALEREAAAAAAEREAEREGLTREQRDRIDHLLSGDRGEDATLDENAVKKLVLNFEKKALKNQELRIKFPEEPQKFMESEIELHDSIQDLRALATVPELYPVLVRDLNCVPSFLGLLSHENADISVAAVDLLQELTDVDTLNESEDGAAALVEAFTAHQACPLLVQNLERLRDEVKEESDGVHNTLSIFENLVEFRPEVCGEAAEAGLLAWLVKRLKVKVPFDNNKLYASEILSIFLQSEPENRKRFGELGAIDSLLQQLAYYKRHNPSSAEEIEMMENLFDCLCSLLLYPPNRDLFLKGEGLQLMNLMLRERKVSRSGALKVLNHALIGPEGKENCAKFVDVLGLRTIFPLLMKTPKKNKRKGVSAEEHEEHAISVVASLMKNCTGQQKARLLAKFTEADHEKVDRVMELHFNYFEKVRRVEARLKRDPATADMDEDELYLRRLDLGLFNLQLIDFIIAEASASGASSVKQRVLKFLSLRPGSSVMDIKNVLREYAENIGEGENEGGESERQHLLDLVNKF